MQTVTVVGARGFVGRHVIAELATRPDVESLGIASDEYLTPTRLEWVRSSVVLWASGMRPPAQSFDENVTRFGRFLEEVLPTRVVLVSSVSAVGPVTAYGWSKWMQERVLESSVAFRGANARIARLVTLYGEPPRVPGTADALARLSVLDLWMAVALHDPDPEIGVSVGARLDMLHVEDAARALVDMALELRPYSATLEHYDVGSGTAWDLAEIVGLVPALVRRATGGVTMPPAGEYSGRRYLSEMKWTPQRYIESLRQRQLEAFEELEGGASEVGGRGRVGDRGPGDRGDPGS